MISALLVFMAVTVGLLIAYYRRIGASLNDLRLRLVRIENALGAEEYLEFLKEATKSDFPEIRQSGVIAQLERIEIAVDPLARAKHDVEQLMQELDAALQQDASYAYEHSRVGEIQNQLEKGERPQREVWESRIGTPFPWA